MFLLFFILLFYDVEIKEVYDFGEILTGKLVPHTFIFQNDSLKKIKILNLKSTDHLEVLSFPEEIPPKSTGEINVILDTNDLKGKIKRGLNIDYLFEGEEDVKKARFIIEGIVHLPVEASHLKEESIFFSYYPSNPHHTFKLSFFSDQISDYKIDRIEITGNKKINFKKEIFHSKEKNTFFLKVYPEEPPEIGNYSFYIAIKTNVPEASEILLPFFFEIKDPFVISEKEVVFNLNKIFNRVKVIKNCYFYNDFEMKSIFDDLIDLNNIYVYVEKEGKSYIGNDSAKFWINSDCIEKIKPSQFQKTRTIFLNHVHKKPFKINFISFDSRHVTYFLREQTPYSKSIVLSLKDNAEEERTEILIKTDYPGKEEIKIPILIIKE